jgi:AcrR family transcriptional regulator
VIARDAVTVAGVTALDAIVTLADVSRWEPDAVGRLQAAALELFAEQGFERTTVAEITQRAGLTTRTFFNHFADKREVLFKPLSEMQRDVVTRGIADCSTALSPLDAMLNGLRAAADELFEERRAAVMRRREIIEANPELRERELGKRAALTDTIAAALRARGLDPDGALLIARVGALVQQTAMQRWTESTDERPLREFLTDAMCSLRTVVSRDESGASTRQH